MISRPKMSDLLAETIASGRDIGRYVTEKNEGFALRGEQLRITRTKTGIHIALCAAGGLELCHWEERLLELHDTYVIRDIEISLSLAVEQ